MLKRMNQTVILMGLGVGAHSGSTIHAQSLISCTPKQTICAIETKTGLVGDRVTFHLPKAEGKRKKAAIAKGEIISVKARKGSSQRALVRIHWGHGDIPHKAIPKPPTDPVSSWESSFSQNE